MRPAPLDPAKGEQRALDGALLRGMGAIAVFVAIAGCVKLGQDAAIAWRYGTGAAVDAYYFLMSVTAWPLAVCGAVLTFLVAPADVRLRSVDPQAARQLRGELLGTALLLALLMLPLAWWTMSALALSPLGGLSEEAAAQAVAGAAELAVLVPLGLVAALLSAWLVAAGRHVLALLEGVPALLVLVLVLAPIASAQVLFWATAAGFALQVAVMLWLLGSSGELPRPRLAWSSLHWRTISHGALLLLVAQSLLAFVPLIDIFFAAHLGTGTVAQLSYTNRLILGLQGILGLAVQRGGLPLLARLGSRSRGTVGRWAVAMAAAGALVGVLVALIADPLVAMLFERGDFTAADSAQCAMLLRYGMLQMPVFLASMALVTGLASVNARGAIAAVAVVNLAVKILASLAFVPQFGAAGLMISTACMYTAAAAIAWFVLRPHAVQDEAVQE